MLHDCKALLGFSAEIGLDISQIVVTATMTLTLDLAIRRGQALKDPRLIFVKFL